MHQSALKSFHVYSREMVTYLIIFSRHTVQVQEIQCDTFSAASLSHRRLYTTVTMLHEMIYTDMWEKRNRLDSCTWMIALLRGDLNWSQFKGGVNWSVQTAKLTNLPTAPHSRPVLTLVISFIDSYKVTTSKCAMSIQLCIHMTHS